MAETEIELSFVVADVVFSLPMSVTYEYHRGIPAISGGAGEPPISPEEPECVEITVAWTNLPMQPKPAGSPHKPTFRYNMIPLLSEEQIKALEENILEEHEVETG